MRTVLAAGVCAALGTTGRAPAAPAEAIEAPAQPFADDSMTRQSAASLYEADSVPAFEPPVSAEPTDLDSAAAPASSPEAAPTRSRITRATATHHRRHVHHRAIASAAPASASAPATGYSRTPTPVPAHSYKHLNVAMKFFTWWNYTVRGHPWAQVPWAPNDHNHEAGLG